MVVEWTAPAVQDLKDFREITKMSVCMCTCNTHTFLY